MRPPQASRSCPPEHEKPQAVSLSALCSVSKYFSAPFFHAIDVACCTFYILFKKYFLQKVALTSSVPESKLYAAATTLIINCALCNRWKVTGARIPKRAPSLEMCQISES